MNASGTDIFPRDSQKSQGSNGSKKFGNKFKKINFQKTQPSQGLNQQYNQPSLGFERSQNQGVFLIDTSNISFAGSTHNNYIKAINTELSVDGEESKSHKTPDYEQSEGETDKETKAVKTTTIDLGILEEMQLEEIKSQEHKSSAPIQKIITYGEDTKDNNQYNAVEVESMRSLDREVNESQKQQRSDYPSNLFADSRSKKHFVSMIDKTNGIKPYKASIASIDQVQEQQTSPSFAQTNVKKQNQFVQKIQLSQSSQKKKKFDNVFNKRSSSKQFSVASNNIKNSESDSVRNSIHELYRGTPASPTTFQKMRGEKQLEKLMKNKDSWGYSPRKSISNQMAYSREIERANSKARMSQSREKLAQLDALAKSWLEEEKQAQNKKGVQIKKINLVDQGQ